MMCLIVKSRKPFISAKLKNKLFSFDKYDPNNLKLPSIIENIKDDNLLELIPKIIEKYKKHNYLELNREELEEIDIWSDLEVLLLLKFYKNGWSFEIPNSDEFFPKFAFTYNIEPLKKQIDKIVGFAYDKIEQEMTKEELKNNRTFSALEVTYLLHYFVITHPNYS